MYTAEECKDFFGLRDWYELIKSLRRRLQGTGKKVAFVECVVDDTTEEFALNSDLLTMSLCRNFGGKAEFRKKILDIFHLKCFGYRALLKPPSMPSLLRANQEDQTNPRHLMILTSSQAILPLLFSCEILQRQTTDVLIGSGFQMDLNELHLVQQIDRVKVAMSKGETCVLLNHNNIYEVTAYATARRIHCCCRPCTMY